MIIKSLKLENYRRFEQLDIDLPETVIGIIGRNGSGKSTLVEAISWALYGNRFVRTDKNDIRSQHVDTSKDCSAEMIFEYGGAEYRIIRKLKGKNAISESAVYRTGIDEPQAVQDRGVNAFIEQLLKLDYRSFTASVFAKQKELAKLASLQPEQRRQTINRLINIDQIDRARDQVRRDRNDKQSTLKGMQSGLKDMVDLKQRLKLLKTEKSKTDENLSEQNKAVGRVNHAHKTAQQEYDSAAELREKFQNVTSRIESAQQRIKDQTQFLKTNQDELANIKKAEEDLAPLQTRIEPLPGLLKKKETLDADYKRYNDLQIKREKQTHLKDLVKQDQVELERLNPELETQENLLTRKQKLNRDKQQLETELAQWREKVKQAHADLKTAEFRGKELSNKLDEIRKLGPDSPCPVCTQKLGNHFEEVTQDHEKQLKQLRQDYKTAKQTETAAQSGESDCQQKLDETRRQLEGLSVDLSRIEQAKQQAGDINKRLASNQTLLQQLQRIIQAKDIDYDAELHEEINTECTELQRIQQTVIQLQERVKRKPVLEEQITQNRKTIRDLETRLSELESERKALDYDEERFQQKKRRVDELAAERDKAIETLNDLKEKSAVLASRIENTEQDIQEQKQRLKEIDVLREDISYLNALDEHFGRFRLHLAGRVRPFIAARASELIKLTTLSRYTTLELDEDYTIRLFDGNIPHLLERFSGGEQDLTNLCLRIAISQVVAERSGGAPINFIILDEIFGSQDTERRELILNALSYLSSQFRQILIITHIDSIQDMLPAIFQVSADDHQTSSVRVLA
ncbi:MAG: SMC family ATPase [candidate division KSB1 bacterium]|nr:SMC family ATPase [candidate division KSB1 bacterium]